MCDRPRRPAAKLVGYLWDEAKGSKCSLDVTYEDQA
jgi:hypothetical protein